jgi:hypothetical protein
MERKVLCYVKVRATKQIDSLIAFSIEESRPNHKAMDSSGLLLPWLVQGDTTVGETIPSSIRRWPNRDAIVQVAIVGADLKKGMSRTIPPVEDFLNQILTLAELKPHRPLVRLPTGITLNSEDHPFSLAVVPFPAAPRFL